MERWDAACEELEALERVGGFVVSVLGVCVAILLVLAVAVVMVVAVWREVLRLVLAQ